MILVIISGYIICLTLLLENATKVKPISPFFVSILGFEIRDMNETLGKFVFHIDVMNFCEAKLRLL